MLITLHCKKYIGRTDIGMDRGRTDRHNVEHSYIDMWNIATLTENRMSTQNYTFWIVRQIIFY